eukprot:gnl/TRDRNA2_/TRDRNA2_126000_c1_seq1.p1 gnl/TRDRNA2_/TRDRNA2_126000_c1~~gnl/TRDRNA2_/TRDRNA2_126000_c1_seq1.p1  ORF type:complete len:161 (+),score=7.40 gnl/TRDRNA2_/TRDRNA2_126000_c1_seq1:219-701(+)
MVVVSASEVIGSGRRQSTLKIFGRPSVTEACLSAIAQSCPSLEVLNLAGCQAGTDVGLWQLAVGCTQLQALYVRHCQKVKDVGVFVVAICCSKLRTLDVTGCRSVTQFGAEAAKRVNNELSVYPELVKDPHRDLRWHHMDFVSAPAPFTPCLGGDQVFFR